MAPVGCYLALHSFDSSLKTKSLHLCAPLPRECPTTSCTTAVRAVFALAKNWALVLSSDIIIASSNDLARVSDGLRSVILEHCAKAFLFFKDLSATFTLASRWRATRRRTSVWSLSSWSCQPTEALNCSTSTSSTRPSVSDADFPTSSGSVSGNASTSSSWT